MIVQSRLGRVKKPKLTKIALTTSSMRLKEVMKVNNPKKLSVSSDEETAITSDSGVLADRLILWAGRLLLTRISGHWLSPHVIGC